MICWGHMLLGACFAAFIVMVPPMWSAAKHVRSAAREKKNQAGQDVEHDQKS